MFLTVVFLMIMMAVMIAVHARRRELAAQERAHRFVRVSGRSGDHDDPGVRKSLLRALPHAAADQKIDPVLRKKSRERFMADAAGAHHF